MQIEVFVAPMRDTAELLQQLSWTQHSGVYACRGWDLGGSNTPLKIFFPHETYSPVQY